MVMTQDDVPHEYNKSVWNYKYIVDEYKNFPDVENGEKCFEAHSSSKYHLSQFVFCFL